MGAREAAEQGEVVVVVRSSFFLVDATISRFGASPPVRQLGLRGTEGVRPAHVVPSPTSPLEQRAPPRRPTTRSRLWLAMTGYATAKNTRPSQSPPAAIPRGARMPRILTEQERQGFPHVGVLSVVSGIHRHRDYVLSRYPVLKIHHTAARQMARKRLVIARLTTTLTSAIS